jgi:hypothetical protein
VTSTNDFWSDIEMDGNEELYGSSIMDKINLIATWAPLLAKLEAITIAKTPQDKALAVIDALRLAADKTLTDKDNKFLDAVASVLKTQEGAALASLVAALAGVAA